MKTKEGGKGEEREKIKMIVLSVPATSVIQNSKKIAKKFKKLKNTIMDSFQAEVGWKRMRKRVNKNYCSDLFLPEA